MPVTLDLYEFDKTKKRDPQDRQVVDALRRYVEERGGTAAEFDWDGSLRLDETANFMFGWEGEHVAYFRCNKMRTEQGDVEIAPPHSLAELGHIRRVATGEGYQADFSFLGELKTLAFLEIYTMPKDEKRFPVSWACASALTTLRILYEEGSMRSVPDCFQGLQELQDILILHRQSKAMALPDWLGALPHLERLWLLGHFASIPYSLVQAGLPFSDDLRARRGIVLFHATLDEGDVGLYLSNDRELIEQFYAGDQVSEDDAIRECKVIFLGDGGAGKSSLIQRVMEDTFELGKLPTDGMRVIPWRTELIDGRPFLLRFLDFGGQEIMHSMHRCFLSGHTVYVVVCAARDDTEIDAVAARWLEQVKAYAPGCPVILALNKADENPGISVNETNLRERFPALKAVLKTSAAVQAGHEFHAAKLYSAIMEYAPGCVQELTRNRGMLAVQKALEKMSAQKEPYITAEAYRKLCEDNGITTTTLQRSLLEWFRDLGIAYFYEQKEDVDLRLESLRVLNPVWLTNGIYRLILRAGEKVKNGILTHDDIREILSTSYRGDAEDVTYSAEETEFVLHVMRMFEISHKMGNGRELIPMLMEKNAKKTADIAKQAIHHRWEGAFLPNNLIHKLMIQKYEELDQKFMWRTGARFHPKNKKLAATAVMRDDKSLDLYVLGGSEDARREYLNGFREKIGGILRSLNLNETKEYICCTVNGKEGKVAYETVVASCKRGLAEIPIEGTGGFASPAELLKWVEKDPDHARTLDPGMPEQLKTAPSTNVDDIKTRAETRQINLKTGAFALGILILMVCIAYTLITGQFLGMSIPDLIQYLSNAK